jgi:hypothetical protein
MAVRTTLAAQIAKVRTLINDPSGASPQFDDQTIQDQLDQNRDDVWYEPLRIAPAIVNAASTNNVPSMLFADYYSDFTWWEADVILQGNSTSTHAAWVVLTPVASDLIVGHWSFEAGDLATLFATGTFPGQYPPVWATGKAFDIYATAADLCDIWSAYLAGSYDVTVDGQTFRRSQLMAAKQTLAKMFRHQAKPTTAKMVRRDVLPSMDSKSVPILGGGDSMSGMSGRY